MTISPLLKFSLESLEEGLDQYSRGTEMGRKFSILLCDQSVELLLKEKLRCLGTTIYLKNGRTVDFYDALNNLVSNKGIKIPEVANLELLHEERNLIQHKGATVSKGEAEFYMKKGFDFVERFLREELDFELKNHLQKKFYQAFEELEEPDELLERLVERKESENIISLVLLHYRDLEILIWKALAKMGYPTRYRPLSESIKTLQESGFKIKEPEEVHTFIKLRNTIAHTDKVPNKKEIKPLIDAVRNLKFRLRKYLSE